MAVEVDEAGRDDEAARVDPPARQDLGRVTPARLAPGSSPSRAAPQHA